MRSRSFVLVVAALVGLFALAGGVLAYDSSQRDTIADGVKVGGVDVGGLSGQQARARLERAYSSLLDRPLVASYRSHRFLLSPRTAAVAVDVNGGVASALDQSRGGDIFTRAWRSLTGGRLNADIEPHVSYSRGAVAAFERTIKAALDTPPHDASISYSGDSIGAVSSRAGLAVDGSALGASLQNALSHPSASRSLAISVTVTPPKVTTHQLSAEYPTIITIDRSAFKLRLWKHLRLTKSYTIAVGMAGLETPAGLYHIQDKEVDPSWHVPNSAWAGSLAGQTIPPGPQDPIKARWMGIYNGAGIHGTDELGSLGSAASHGCIRMAIPDVIELYGQTPLGTPVYIA